MTVDELISKISKSCQHTCLYHFTDGANVASIQERGLISKERMRRERWWPVATGGNKLSHELDTARGIDPYVSLCMTTNHGMLYHAQTAGRITTPKHFRIRPEVLKIEGAMIAFGVANGNGVEILPVADAVEKLDVEVLYDRTDWKDVAVQQRLRAAERMEVLIPDMVPRELIERVF